METNGLEKNDEPILELSVTVAKNIVPRKGNTDNTSTWQSDGDQRRKYPCKNGEKIVFKKGDCCKLKRIVKLENTAIVLHGVLAKGRAITMRNVGRVLIVLPGLNHIIS